MEEAPAEEPAAEEGEPVVDFATFAGHYTNVTIRRLNQTKADSPENAAFLNGSLKIDFASGCAYVSDEELHLTPIEYKLLCLLARNCGKVLTHKYITQQIWGATWENNVASLRVFMATLRKKLEVSPDASMLIQTHVGIGYRMLRIMDN